MCICYKIMSTPVLFVCLLTSIASVKTHPLLQSLPIQALLNNINCHQQQNVAAQIPHQHTPCQQQAVQQQLPIQQNPPCQQHNPPFQQQNPPCQPQNPPSLQQKLPCQQQNPPNVQQNLASQQQNPPSLLQNPPLQQQNPTCQQQNPPCHKHAMQQISPNMNQVIEAVLKNQGTMYNHQPTKNQGPMYNNQQLTQTVGQPAPDIKGNECHNHNLQPQIQNQQTPQVVNNYFVLPPELFLNGTQKPGEDKNHNVEIKGDVCTCEKQNDVAVHIKEKLSKIDAGGVVDMLNGKSQHCHVNNGLKMPIAVPDNLKRYYEVYDMIKNARKQKQTMGNSCNCNEHKYGRPVNTENYPKEDFQKHNLYTEYFNPQVNKKSHDIQNGCLGKEANSDIVEPIGDLLDFVDESQLKNENRKARNPSDDTIVRNVKTKYPKLPELVVRKLLSDMKNQLMKQQKAEFWNPYGEMMKNFHPMMPMYMANNMTSHKNMPWYPQQKPKSGKGKRRRNNKSGSNVTASKNNTDVINDTNINQNASANGKKYEESFSSNGEHSQLSKPKLFENTTPYGEAHREYMIPELGTEDSIPNIDENDIDSDDNPDFSKTFDEDYYYDEDETERSERDTPRAKATEMRRRRKEYRRNHSQNNGRNRSRNRMNHEDVHETEKPEIFDEEEIVFKIPPGLESPDFQTVKVNREDPEYYDDYYPIFYKTSSMDIKEDESEDNKTYLEPMPQMINEEEKTTTQRPKPDKIETFHANSKTVNYSQHTEEAVSVSRHKEQSKRKNDTTIVVAKTVV